MWDEPAATYERASDEHGRLAVTSATNRLHIGDKIRLVPGHCDPTVNLYDWYVGIRGDRVEAALADHRSRCGVLTDGSDRIVSGLRTSRGWCGRRDSNPHSPSRSRFSYHFGFRRRLTGVRGPDYPFAIALRP